MGASVAVAWWEKDKTGGWGAAAIKITRGELVSAAKVVSREF